MSIKEVRFDQYCKDCQHCDLKETEDPCDECLTRGWNEDSRKPINFKKKDSTK